VLNGRIKRLEGKYVRDTIVYIVMPGESKNKVILKSNANMFNQKDVFVIIVTGV